MLGRDGVLHARWPPSRRARSETTCRAKRSGLTLEKAFDRTHHRYLARDLACLSHLHPETVGPPTRLRRSAPGDCDYMGWWMTPMGERPIAFDAKSSSRATLSLPTQPSTRKSWQHQMKFLIGFGSKPNTTAAFIVVDRELGFGWFLFRDGMQRILDGHDVPLRSITRGGITHHAPHFALADTEALARDEPLVDWYPALHAIQFPGAPIR
jgi:hypothetical protein